MHVGRRKIKLTANGIYITHTLRLKYYLPRAEPSEGIFQIIYLWGNLAQVTRQPRSCMQQLSNVHICPTNSMRFLSRFFLSRFLSLSTVLIYCA